MKSSLDLAADVRWAEQSHPSSAQLANHSLTLAACSSGVIEECRKAASRCFSQRTSFGQRSQQLIFLSRQPLVVNREIVPVNGHPDIAPVDLRERYWLAMNAIHCRLLCCLPGLQLPRAHVAGGRPAPSHRPDSAERAIAREAASRSAHCSSSCAISSAPMGANSARSKASA